MTPMQQLLKQLKDERFNLPMHIEWDRCYQAIEYVIQNTYIPLEKETISDDVLFEQATVAMEEVYGYGCETEIDAYFRGAKWILKQINK